MPTEKPRFIVTVDDDFFEKIENYRFENRYPNRNLAIRAILEKGFERIEDEQKNEKKEEK